MAQKVIFITGSGPWTVPNDCYKADIIAIGAGGGGSSGATNYKKGGGGGGFSLSAGVLLTPKSVAFVSVPAGGTGGSPAGGNGGDVWFNKSFNAAPSSESDGVLAKGGAGSTSGVANAAGGAAASGVGTTKYSGGNGGSASSNGGGGGGGAASAASDGSAGSNSTSNNGGDGGNSGTGTGQGAGGAGSTTSSVAGGTGGAGSQYTANNVWNGSAYLGTTPTGGPGGGGGGAFGNGSSSSGFPAPGGSYGGGGGGGAEGFIVSLGETGGPGLIIVIYDDTFVGQSTYQINARNADLFFSDTVQAMLAGRNIHAALGVWFDFLSGKERVWLGRGTFTANDGTEWQGMGTLASIDGVSSSAGLSVEPITMTLSGLTTEILDLTRQQATEIRGRRCGVYILMFDDDFKPLDMPYLLDLYLMDKATFTVEGDARQMSITVTAEPLFSTKHVPRFSLVTDADQQSRYPGDKIFERVALLSGRQTLIWSSDT